jgi:hypothetical protein
MAARGTSRKHVRFAPYRHEPFGLRVQPRGCRLDDTRSISPFNLETHLADLVEHRFKSVDMDFTIEVPREVIDVVFPESERQQPPAQLILAVRCPKTRLRRTVVVAAGPLAATSFDATVALERAELRGNVEIVPFLVRTEASRSSEPGFASALGAQVASARPWEIRVDLLRPPAGNYIEVNYVSFKEHGPPQFRFPDNLYQLSSDKGTPTLWLNTDHPHIVEVLDSKGTFGVRARIREVLFDTISHSVWTRLFLKAASDARGGDDVPFEWEDAVLDTFLPKLYPEAKGRSSQLEALRDEIEAGDLAQVLDRLDEVLQRRLETAKHANKLIVDGAKLVEAED